MFPVSVIKADNKNQLIKILLRFGDFGLGNSPLYVTYTDYNYKVSQD